MLSFKLDCHTSGLLLLWMYDYQPAITVLLLYCHCFCKHSFSTRQRHLLMHQTTCLL